MGGCSPSTCIQQRRVSQLSQCEQKQLRNRGLEHHEKIYMDHCFWQVFKGLWLWILVLWRFKTARCEIYYSACNLPAVTSLESGSSEVLACKILVNCYEIEFQRCISLWTRCQIRKRLVECAFKKKKTHSVQIWVRPDSHVHTIQLLSAIFNLGFSSMSPLIPRSIFLSFYCDLLCDCLTSHGDTFIYLN